MLKRPYPSGPKKKRGSRSLSEYARELAEKQRLKKWYNLGEREFKNYIKKVLQRRGKTRRAEDPVNLLIRDLESRLDNVVFRLGFSQSRGGSRQLVSHGFFMVNSKLIDTPSYRVKKGDVISVSPTRIKKSIIQNLLPLLKKTKTADWLELDINKLEGKVIGLPTAKEVNPPAEISVIFEFYSR